MIQAIAILKSGRSFSEVGAITGVSVDEIMKEWEKVNGQ